ncbi:ParA family protein [Spiroplasma endosymbiont of Megaselia nigra]|uniref:ParA family protein n=1 Tax=Spiroplasma endosymbiont of Megaselia nigra TaxID=2478537 RepID=UPI0013159F0C|nr:ParA family protein [Spiroplasma endosymbiont of Megaselia nigra]
MKMISFCNKKGGVGKTTLCKNVAYKLALDGAKVLLIDLDPQATLTLQTATKNISNENCILDLIATKNLLNIIKVNNVIKETKYKNIDIIMGNETLTNSNVILNSSYDEQERLLISDLVYEKNKDIFDSYDYVLIDYPPTIQELAISFLLISDLIVVPTNDGLNSIKGIIDLKNTLNHFAKKIKKEILPFKIIFNQVKDNHNINSIRNNLIENNLIENIINTVFYYSDTFKVVENDLSSIWENPYYWRQKQAYEELIKEIK